MAPTAENEVIKSFPWANKNITKIKNTITYIEKKLQIDSVTLVFTGFLLVLMLTTAFGLVVAVILQILQNTVLYIIDNQIVSIQKSVNSFLKSVENFSK